MNTLHNARLRVQRISNLIPPRRGIAGLYFQQPRDRRLARLIELRRSGLAAETIAGLCRESLETVLRVTEGVL